MESRIFILVYYNLYTGINTGLYWIIKGYSLWAYIANPVKQYNDHHMAVSKNRGTPKWMVKIMEHPIRIDDLGVPLFLETPIDI